MPFYPNIVPAPDFQRRCFAHIIAKSYTIRTVIQLLSTSGFYLPPQLVGGEKDKKSDPFVKVSLQHLIADFFRQTDKLF